MQQALIDNQGKYSTGQQGVVTLKGAKHLSVVTANVKAQITVVACVNAAGNAMPPLVIFDWKILKDDVFSLWGIFQAVPMAFQMMDG